MSKAFTNEEIEDAIELGGNAQAVLAQVHSDNKALKCERDGVAIEFGKCIRKGKKQEKEIARLKAVIEGGSE